MSVVWEDESVGGFCGFPRWDLCTVSLLGSSVSLVLVGLLPVCGPMTHSIYPQSQSSLVTGRHNCSWKLGRWGSPASCCFGLPLLVFLDSPTNRSPISSSQNNPALNQDPPCIHKHRALEWQMMIHQNSES